MHPATGPISPEMMRALADAPYGKAGEVLRQHDPLWGLTASGATMKSWKVVVQKAEPMTATTYVEAPSEAVARSMVNAMDSGEFDWEPDGYEDDFEIWSIKEERK